MVSFHVYFLCAQCSASSVVLSSVLEGSRTHFYALLRMSAWGMGAPPVNLSLISSYRSVLSATEFEGSESFFPPLPDSAEDSELLQHKGEQRRVNNLTH